MLSIHIVLRLLLGRPRDGRDTEPPSEANSNTIAESKSPYSHGVPLARPDAGENTVDSWVVLFPPPALGASLPPVVQLSTESYNSRPISLYMSPITSSSSSRLSDMSPMVSLMSPHPLRAECKFSVFCNSSGAVIHEEDGRLTRDFRSLESNSMYSLTYATSLPVGVFRTICSDSSKSGSRIPKITSDPGCQLLRGTQ
jgi:hypothetical protein